MTWTHSQKVLAILMVITGSFNTLSVKYVNFSMYFYYTEKKIIPFSFKIFLLFKLEFLIMFFFLLQLMIFLFFCLKIKVAGIFPIINNDSFIINYVQGNKINVNTLICRKFNRISKKLFIYFYFHSFYIYEEH